MLKAAKLNPHFSSAFAAFAGFVELQSDGIALASVSVFSRKSGNSAGNSGQCAGFLRNAAFAPKVDLLAFPEMLGGVSSA